jgi:lipoate---protein ligase
MGDRLRVIDFGRVSPLRSQTLWHAIGYGVSAGQPATLSFTRPAGPYVSLGFLRDAAEVDHGYCAVHGLPVYRRMVGGGPVYLDDRQLLFQICLPARDVPPARADALRRLLEPAVAAFRAAGVQAILDDNGEICLGDRKICGHGAGQIEDAVVVCGNLIETFDYHRATCVLAFSDPVQQAETLHLMQRYVTATPAADPAVFRGALIAAYASALGLTAVRAELSGAEIDAAARLDQRFSDPRWLAGPAGTVRPARPGRQIKIRAGIWTYAGEADGGIGVAASVIKGRLDRVVLTAPDQHGQATDAERALTGAQLSAAGDVLGRFGAPGRQLAAALAGAEGRLG